MAQFEDVKPDRWMPRGEAWVPSRRTPMVVWQGIVGEQAEVRVVHRGRNLVRAKWNKTDTPSPHRVDPPCKRYQRCGGCPWMHMDGEGQASAHRALVQQWLDDAGLNDVELGQFHACPDGMEAFRHVVKVGVAMNDQERTRVGAWARGTRQIVPIPECNVANPVLRKTMKSLAHHVIDLDVWPYQPDTGRGVLRAAVMRASRTTGQVLLTLIAARKSPLVIELAEAVAQGVSEIAGVGVHYNASEGNAIFDRDEEGIIHIRHLTGRSQIEETIGGVTYSVGAGDFFQTNPSVAEILYQRTLERLDINSETTLVDLYCGVGGLALQAAKAGAGFVMGVEILDGAVQRARTAARQNRLRAEFMVGRVDQVIHDLSERLRGIGPIVTVNPARRGLEEGVIEEILQLDPSQLAYISCNPSALSRDLVQLREAGFSVKGPIEMFDMFPNTPHVECLVILERDVAQSGRRAPRRKVVR